MSEQCDVCEQPWEVRFEWDYTDTEQYCYAHMLEPIDNQPGKTLLDFMPDCQKITHRITRDRHGFVGRQPPGRPVRYHSLAAVYPVITGRMMGWTAT